MTPEKQTTPQNQTRTVIPNQEGGTEAVKIPEKPPAPQNQTRLVKQNQGGGAETVKAAVKGGGKTPEPTDTETKTYSKEPNQGGETKPEGEENLKGGGATHHSRIDKKKTQGRY